MLETSKNPLSTPIIGAPLGNNYTKEAPGQILERIWRVPVVQQAFFQRASKDGVTQRGERIVLCWVTGREELRRTSARTKNSFFQFFFWPAPWPVYLGVLRKNDPNFIFLCRADKKIYESVGPDETTKNVRRNKTVLHNPCPKTRHRILVQIQHIFANS